jgi:hypothetical protein
MKASDIKKILDEHQISYSVISKELYRTKSWFGNKMSKIQDSRTSVTLEKAFSRADQIKLKYILQDEVQLYFLSQKTRALQCKKNIDKVLKAHGFSEAELQNYL